MNSDTPPAPPPPAASVIGWSWRSLPAKLLMFTVVFIMIGEIVVFVPSLVAFRDTWLRDRLEGAQIAILALEATPDNMISPELEKELLANAGVLSVALQRDESRSLALAPAQPETIAASFDLRRNWLQCALDVFAMPAADPKRIVRLVGTPRHGGGNIIEVTVREELLRTAMLQFSLRILGLSLVIAAVAGVLIFFSLNRMLVRPMRRLTGNMVAFRDNPGEGGAIIEPSGRRDEIGAAERALAGMQGQVRAALSQKNRLAELGAAVSKVNHDLRNILASAQLVSDRIGAVDDPDVRRLAPKLLASISRAVGLCTRTLRYGQASEPPPDRTTFTLCDLVDDVGRSVDFDGAGVAWINEVPPTLRIHADPDQLFRILLNLGRNAVQAISRDADRKKGGGRVHVSAQAQAGEVIVTLRDTGPGVSDVVRDRLFEPFSGSSQGSGLGLTIARELAEAHGGGVELVRSNHRGAVFRLRIPSAISSAEGNVSPIRDTG